MPTISDCPWCGNEAKLIFDEQNKQYSVECIYCLMRGPIADGEQYVIGAWELIVYNMNEGLKK